MSREPAIEASELELAYRGNGKSLLALDRVTFSIEQGQFLAIVGPSGSGKTSLLRLIANLIEPTGGALRVLGDHPNRARAERAFSFMFQDPVLLPWRTVLENVELPQVVSGKQDRNPRETLELVGLGEATDLYPQQLSGGMQQRTALARALSYNPKILLLDEPFAAVDELLRERLNGLLAELQQRLSLTCVLVTHSLHEAVFLADRVLILSPRPGRIVRDRTVSFPRPRQLTLLASPEFDTAVRELRQDLR